MPRSSNGQVPARYVVDGVWPDAVLVPYAPVSAHYGQALASNLQRTMRSAGYTLRRLAEASGVAHTTIGRVLRGEVLADMGTIARLEVALAVQVFPKPAEHPTVDCRMRLTLGELQGLATDDAAQLAAARRRLEECEQTMEQARAAFASAHLRAEVSTRVAHSAAKLVARAFAAQS